MKQRALRKGAILAQHAIRSPARCAGEFLLARLAAEPIREEAVDDAIAGLEARDARADRLDGPGRVRDGNQGDLLARSVAALERDEVAIIERHGADADEDLAGARLRHRPL